jgi:hypothetical protein
MVASSIEAAAWLTLLPPQHFWEYGGVRPFRMILTKKAKPQLAVNGYGFFST